MGFGTWNVELFQNNLRKCCPRNDAQNPYGRSIVLWFHRWFQFETVWSKHWTPLPRLVPAMAKTWEEWGGGRRGERREEEGESEREGEEGGRGRREWRREWRERRREKKRKRNTERTKQKVFVALALLHVATSTKSKDCSIQKKPRSGLPINGATTDDPGKITGTHGKF